MKFSFSLPLCLLATSFRASRGEGTIRGGKQMHTSSAETDSTPKAASNTSVYSLAPSDISDDELEAFATEPRMEVPFGERKLHVPSELSDDPNDPSWVFEGYLLPTDTETSAALESKRENMRKYFESISDGDRKDIQGRLQAQRQQKAKVAAESGGIPFDEREVVAIAITENLQVWSLRATDETSSMTLALGEDSFVGDAASVLSNTGENSDDTGANGRDLSSAGLGLSLVSGHNGNDMTAYPWRAQGCLSVSTSSAGCFCSGTKISARLVLTAGHCLTVDHVVANYWLSGADGIDQQLNGEDDTPNGVRSSSARLVPPEWFNFESPDHDWGLFVLQPTTSNCNLGWFGYEAPSSLVNGVVNIYGYPGFQCEASPLSSGECWGSLHGDSASVQGINGGRFNYPIDTQGGMSGSGVYTYNSQTQSRRVVGVHAYGAGLTGLAVAINSNNLAAIESVRAQYPDSTAC